MCCSRGSDEEHLAPETKSGYVGVRPTKSKKRPWQAWIHIKGEEARSGAALVHSGFRTPQEAAVARARVMACGAELGAETLPSPRRQAARNSDIAECRGNPPVLGTYTV